MLKSKTRLLAFTALLKLAILGTVAAIQITQLTEYVSVWTGIMEKSAFTIQSLVVKPKGHNRVTVELKVKNTSSQSVSANVTVQLLDSSGNLIGELEETQTITVNGGESEDLTFTFTRDNLVSEYASAFVIIIDL